MSRYDPAALQRLLFRRQFVLGPRAVDRFPSWQHVALGPDLWLTVHPDLGVTRVAAGERSAVLLGYVVDPSHPAAGDAEILAALLDGARAGGDVLERTASLGGRWVLVVHDGERTILFADAAGLRQVAYTEGPAPGQRWCASQPALLAEVVGARTDDEAAAFLASADPDRHTSLLWFPGDATPYHGVRVLLPNHYLDLRTGRPTRYWPVTDVPVTTRRAALGRSLEIITGLMESVGGRFALMPALTAGWDSRITLAASRAASGSAFYYTGLFGEKTEDAPDVTVPSRLLARMGLRHAILDGRSRIDDAFAATYRRNVTPAFEPYCALAQAVLDGSPDGGVIVSGDAGEIVRCDDASGRFAGGDLTARDLAALTRLPEHPFALAAFERWLAGARAHRHNVPLRDLFAWEQEAGRLQAALLAELDIARESFAPFSCRTLLTTLLGVSERYRQEPAYYLFRSLIRRLWPDVLVEPINGWPQVGAQAALRRTLEWAGLLRLVPRPVKRMAKRLLGRNGSDSGADA